MPLLYFGELAKQSGLGEDTELEGRVQDAILRVLANQSSTGSFGLWSPDINDHWLDAYVTDFLTRAREQKYDVPEQAMVEALTNIGNLLSYNDNIAEQGNHIAYSLYVLARNRRASISDLRYYVDTKLDEFPTPLARAHLGAALALYGDVERSNKAFDSSLQMMRDTSSISLARSDYGSALRDGAAVLALAAESRPAPPILPQLADIVTREWDRRSYTSTQEQAWMLLAARSIENADQDLALAINGIAHSGRYASRMTGDALLTQPVTVSNRMREPLSVVVTTVASPIQPLPAGGDGFHITRTYYTMDGQEANVGSVRQNQRYVVVLNIKPTVEWQSRLLITDLLPAGFEIDNPGLVNSANLKNLSWIPQVEAAHTEFRNDRFVAGIDREYRGAPEFILAYVVRAVTPGTYDHPAANVEDMYRPQFSSRTAAGRMEVLPPE